MSEPAGTRDHAATEAVEAYYIASQWQLMWRKFRRHHLAIAGGVILGVFYFVAIFCDFFSPYPPNQLIGDVAGALASPRLVTNRSSQPSPS